MKNNMRDEMPWVTGVQRVLSILPASFIPVLWAYGTYASTVLNRWPHYNSPDPKDMHLKLFHIIVGLAMHLSYLSIIFWVIIAWACWGSITPKNLSINFIILASAIGLVAVQVVVDPGGLFLWYMD